VWYDSLVSVKPSLHNRTSLSMLALKLTVSVKSLQERHAVNCNVCLLV
jgi:hypothetical protein